MSKKYMTLTILTIILIGLGLGGHAAADEQAAQTMLLVAGNVSAYVSRLPVFSKMLFSGRHPMVPRAGFNRDTLSASANPGLQPSYGGAHFWNRGDDIGEPPKTSKIMETTRAVATAMTFANELAGSMGFQLPVVCYPATDEGPPNTRRRGISAGISVFIEAGRSPHLSLDFAASRTTVRCLARNNSGS